jgi:hypothetical protein
MATRVWYCCQCKDGPVSVANNTGCANCSHKKCNSCTVETNYVEHTLVNTIADAPIITSFYDPCHIGHINMMSAYYDGTHSHAIPLGYTNTSATHGHGEPTDGGDYRWTCSECSADNSYAHDAACWNCQHWKCTYCNVYEVKRK